MAGMISARTIRCASTGASALFPRLGSPYGRTPPRRRLQRAADARPAPSRRAPAPCTAVRCGRRATGHLGRERTPAGGRQPECRCCGRRQRRHWCRAAAPAVRITLEAQVRARYFHRVHRPIRRCIVDNDHLEAVRILPSDAAQRVRRRIPAVEDQDDDADLGCAAAAMSPRSSTVVAGRRGGEGSGHFPAQRSDASQCRLALGRAWAGLSRGGHAVRAAAGASRVTGSWGRPADGGRPARRSMHARHEVPAVGGGQPVEPAFATSDDPGDDVRRHRCRVRPRARRIGSRCFRLHRGQFGLDGTVDGAGAPPTSSGNRATASSPAVTQPLWRQAR